MTFLADQRWVATINPEVETTVQAFIHDERFLARFESKVDRRTAGDDECHIWVGAMSDEGYGNFTVGKRTVRAHRVAWIVRFGAAPGWLYLDHVWPVCRYRFCVNVDHLEAVNQSENVYRGVGIGRANQRAMRWAALNARNEWQASEAA